MWILFTASKEKQQYRLRSTGCVVQQCGSQRIFVSLWSLAGTSIAPCPVGNHPGQRKIKSPQMNLLGITGLMWHELLRKNCSLCHTYLVSLPYLLTCSLFHTYLISLPYLAPYLHQDTNQKTCNCKTKLTGRRHEFLCLNANIQTPTADLFPPDILPMGIWSIHHRIHIMWDAFTCCLKAFLKVTWQ